MVSSNQTKHLCTFRGWYSVGLYSLTYTCHCLSLCDFFLPECQRNDEASKKFYKSSYLYAWCRRSEPPQTTRISRPLRFHHLGRAVTCSGRVRRRCLAVHFGCGYYFYSRLKQDDGEKAYFLTRTYGIEPRWWLREFGQSLIQKWFFLVETVVIWLLFIGLKLSLGKIANLPK